MTAHREMSLDEYIGSKLNVIPSHHRVQREYRQLKEEITRLRNRVAELEECCTRRGARMQKLYKILKAAIRRSSGRGE